MSLPRRLRTGASVTVVATEKPQAHTMEIIPAAPPETTAKTEVITPPGAQPPAPELVHLGAKKEEALAAFDGRPLSSSVAAREAWFRANPGPEQIFTGTLADLEAMWLLDTSLPPPPRTGAAVETAEDTQDAVSVAATGTDGPPHRPAAAETVNDPGPEAQPPVGAPAAPLASGPVSLEDEPDAEHDCAEGGEVA